MALASGFLLEVIGAGPRAIDDRLTRPLDEGLAQKPGCVPSPMDPDAAAALFFDWSHPAVVLQVRGFGVTAAVGPKGCQQSRAQGGAGAGQVPKQTRIGMFDKGLMDQFIVLSDVFLKGFQ